MAPVSEIRKGSVVRIAKAQRQAELLVTDVGPDGRCSLAYIGALSSTDTRLPLDLLEYVREATAEERRTTDPKWTKW